MEHGTRPHRPPCGWGVLLLPRGMALAGFRVVGEQYRRDQCPAGGLGKAAQGSVPGELTATHHPRPTESGTPGEWSVSAERRPEGPEHPVGAGFPGVPGGEQGHPTGSAGGGRGTLAASHPAWPRASGWNVGRPQSQGTSLRTFRSRRNLSTEVCV